MATLVSTNPTLADLAKALDPDGSIAQVVEILNQVNEVLDDMTFIEGNLPTGHRTTVRAGLPQPTWRKLYGGVQPGKSSRVSVTDSCGMLEAYAEVDKALADLNGNTAAFRLSEDKAHIEGMSQEVAQTLFYGNEGTEPEAFTGLAPRYNSLSAENADNIINAGGTGSDNTSIWLVVWGPDTCHGIYPKGSQAGLKHKDLGEVTIENADGANGRMQAYRTHYRWDVGLTLRDWRYVARIANIDVSDLGTLANTKNLLTWMIQASERIPVLGRGRACWYMNRTLREKLRLGIIEKVAGNLTEETVAGKRVMAFDGIPVRRTDAILNTETVVS
ncbi:major capsid protein [Phaeospirillum tilakii]|uniref:Major capsid protein n=1 Tax=Phaeospirillum tilakii TaxID=741673 RepID=A0ABW5C9X4_9PROT